MAKRIDPAIVEQITAAVRELELRSCAEVVVEIRARSGSYAHADARFASLSAFVALLVLLFSPMAFAPVWVAIDVALAWILGLFLSHKSDSVRRLMTTERERVTQARLVAASVFHDRGIANTMAESGVLIYLSLLERHIELLADRGVLQSVPALEWNRIAAEARGAGVGMPTLLDLVQKLTPILERCLPSREGDVDELTSVPRYVTD